MLSMPETLQRLAEPLPQVHPSQHSYSCHVIWHADTGNHSEVLGKSERCFENQTVWVAGRLIRSACPVDATEHDVLIIREMLQVSRLVSTIFCF